MPGVVSLQETPELLRPLSPLERLFDVIDQINGFNFSIAVSLQGTVEHPRWVSAFAQVQQRHPFLKASLNRDDAHAPSMQRVKSPPIPLTFERRTSSTQWQRIMETQAEQDFAASAAPLVRADILEDNYGCDLIVTAHHAAVDGMGILGFIRDLLAVLAGKKLAPLATPPAAEDLMAAARASAPMRSPADPQAVEAWQQFLASRPPRSFERHTGTRRPVISSLRLSPDETARWLLCARQQKTTLGAALLTAFAMAVRGLNPLLKESDIHFSIPVDIRPSLKNEDDFVLSITLPRGLCIYSDPGFWENALAIRPQLAAFQTLDGMEAYFGAVKGIMDLGLEASALVDLLAKRRGVDVTLTNLKHVAFPAVPDGLTVEAVWGPSVSSCYAGGHVLGSATFNGTLHLVYTSYVPLPGLLEKMAEILTQACSDPT